MAQHLEVDQNAINNISQKLAGNDPRVRSYTVKKIKRFLERSSTSNSDLISEINLQRLWKGLHYCMWMADKPLFQEDLAEKLAILTHAFKDPEQSLVFVESFLKIEAQEWHLLDCFRLDKFMMLIRKLMIQALVLLRTHDWSLSLTTKFVEIVDAVLSSGVPQGFVTHVMNVLKDELTNVMDRKLSAEDPWMPKFIELFAKRKLELIDNSGGGRKKKSRTMKASALAKTLREAISAKDVDDATEQLLQFENEVVINREKTQKKRKRKLCADEDEDILQMDEEEFGSEENDESKAELEGDDEDEFSGDDGNESEDQSEEEMDLSVDDDSDGGDQEVPKQKKAKFQKEQLPNGSGKKQPKKYLTSKKVPTSKKSQNSKKNRSSKKNSASKRPTDKTKRKKENSFKNKRGQRPRASDFF